MIDQTTLGHRMIKQQFNANPRVGWQIDPFGHSSVQAYLLGSEVFTLSRCLADVSVFYLNMPCLLFSLFLLPNGCLATSRYMAHKVIFMFSSIITFSAVVYAGRRSDNFLASLYSPSGAGRRGRSPAPATKRGSPPPRKASPIVESLVLHLDQLTRNVNGGHLKEIFGNFGEVVKVELAIDRSGVRRISRSRSPRRPGRGRSSSRSSSSRLPPPKP